MEINMIQSSPFELNFNDLVRQAVRRGASDLHIEPFEDRLAIRVRVDGILLSLQELSNERYIERFLLQAKRACRFDMAKFGVPQDARFQASDVEFDVRASLLPTLHGEKIVLRLLELNKRFSLEEYAAPDEAKRCLRQMLEKWQGMVLVTGPNKTRIDLSHCFMIAKARANLSTERVIMETDTISCVRDSGEHFKAQARGYTAGDDSSFGSTGTFISKQGQVLLAAVLANIAKNAGEAVALAQQSTAVVGIDKAATATNVTGDKGAFVAGKSMVDASATVAQWYLDYAKQLIPSIGIGSGQRVHVVMLDTIRVPTLEVEE